MFCDLSPSLSLYVSKCHLELDQSGRLTQQYQQCKQQNKLIHMCLYYLCVLGIGIYNIHLHTLLKKFYSQLRSCFCLYFSAYHLRVKTNNVKFRMKILPFRKVFQHWILMCHLFNFALYWFSSPLLQLVIAVSFNNLTIILKDSKLPKVFKPVKVRRKRQSKS